MNNQNPANSVELLNGDSTASYYPQFLSPEVSQILFNQLLNEIPWKHEPIVIFGKSVMQPRLTAWHGDPGKAYAYSGIRLEPSRWTPTLLQIKDQIETVFGVQLNSALLNQYRNERDSMGWHRDNEKELGKEPTIFSVSLGEARRFHLRNYTDKKQKITLSLESGSLLVMGGKSQHHWEHSIPKETSHRGPRINITFRTIL